MKLLALIAISFTVIVASTAPQMRSVFTKELRICNFDLFKRILVITCSQLASFARKQAGIDNQSARQFIKQALPYSWHHSNHVSYVEECCGSLDYGCTLSEIYGYCDSVPL